MVDVEIVVTDPKDNAIEGIALQIKVSGNNIIFGPTRPYYLYGITDATGKYIITNAQAYANFDVTANIPNINPIPSITLFINILEYSFMLFYLAISLPRIQSRQSLPISGICQAMRN